MASTPVSTQVCTLVSTLDRALVGTLVVANRGLDVHVSRPRDFSVMTRQGGSVVWSTGSVVSLLLHAGRGALGASVELIVNSG